MEVTYRRLPCLRMSERELLPQVVMSFSLFWSIILSGMVNKKVAAPPTC
jgi:hypothetical protein